MKSIEEVQHEFRVKIGKCPACFKLGPMHKHHLSYVPEKVIVICASCHKKIHMHIDGTVRTGSNPYINPLVKLGIPC